MCLGSNLGDTEDNLARAITRLGEISGVRVDKTSSVFFTEPQNVKEQPWFANQVVRVVCEPDVSAHRLLDALLTAEKDLGRERGEAAVRFGPRIIDIDLLLYGNEVLITPTLEVPHPRMKDRAFVLVPLAELAGDLLFPDGDTLRGALGRLDYRVDEAKIWQD
ncbi:2-amino-4-hydroxy-6-hydroxymethyldihydropteridine diphosphokinase [Desulfobaculum sp.]